MKKVQPVVKIDTNGDFKVMHEFSHPDYGFNAPIDQYFDNEEVNKLLYETRQDVKRQKQIIALERKQKEKSTSTFEEYYKATKRQTIDPLILKEK